MSMWEDHAWEMNDFDDDYCPHIEDIVWIDKKDKSHFIEEMSIEYVQACIGFLEKQGFDDRVIPRAFYERLAQKDEIVTDEFEELS